MYDWFKNIYDEATVNEILPDIIDGIKRLKLVNNLIKITNINEFEKNNSMKTVYFSYAYTTPSSVAESIKEKLSEIGVKVDFYSKGAVYTDIPIKNCDAFVIFLPNNSFSADITKLSMGIQKELALAARLKKDIILAYMSKMAGGPTFYLTEFERSNGENLIKGISGTNSDVIKLLQGEVEIELGTEDDLSWMNTQPKINITLWNSH